MPNRRHGKRIDCSPCYAFSHGCVNCLRCDKARQDSQWAVDMDRHRVGYQARVVGNSEALDVSSSRERDANNFLAQALERPVGVGSVQHLVANIGLEEEVVEDLVAAHRCYCNRSRRRLGSEHVAADYWIVRKLDDPRTVYVVHLRHE